MNPQMQNQEPMLKESIKHFLASYHSGSSDFSPFESIFFRLIQTMLDPPLEVSWFYSAVTCHSAKLSQQNDHPSTKLLVAKDLLNVLTSCSNLSSSPKKIALLAPVVCELYYIVCDCTKNGLYAKSELENLVENIFSHVMMSASLYDYGKEVNDADSVVVCFEDLVRVWTADRGGGSGNFGESLRIFFPVLNEGIWKGRNARCGLLELVGIVLCEVFFLKLCLGFLSGNCREELLKETQNQAVQTIHGFQNCCFLDILLKMLLEPRLPIAALLSSEDAVILQKALYDAVMLFDYSSYAGRWAQLTDSHSKELALLWVLVADSAIQFARTRSDQERAVLYLNVFCDSQLVNGLVNWAVIKSGSLEPNNRPDISTPVALIKWILVLEDQGIRVFDQSALKLRAKEVLCQSSEKYKSPELNKGNSVRDEIDNKDQEMSDLSNNGFPVVNLMNTRIDAGRKRKEALNDLQESRGKHVKLDYFGTSVREKYSPFSGNKEPHFHGSEVKSVVSDDDMEVIG